MRWPTLELEAPTENQIGQDIYDRAAALKVQFNSVRRGNWPYLGGEWKLCEKLMENVEHSLIELCEQTTRQRGGNRSQFANLRPVAADEEWMAEFQRVESLPLPKITEIVPLLVRLRKPSRALIEKIDSALHRFPAAPAPIMSTMRVTGDALEQFVSGDVLLRELDDMRQRLAELETVAGLVELPELKAKLATALKALEPMKV